MDLEVIARQAREAALELAGADASIKDSALSLIAEEIEANRDRIKEENAQDVGLAEKSDFSHALVKRLKLSDAKIDEVIRGLHSLASLDDPVGITVFCTELDDGLELYMVTCPIGVIGAIFESRPDALVQIASLCLKSGNAVILKGGSEAMRTNRLLGELIRDAISRTNIPVESVQLVETREDVKNMLALDEYIDLLVPRGSNALVRHIKENTKIPVLGHADGICHVYVDAEANIDVAVDVSFDAKVQYPAVCNAMETLLVHKDVAEKFLPLMAQKYDGADVELIGDDRTRELLPNVKEATEDDWRMEYNDLILSIKIVDSAQEAIEHINHYGSHHTDSIITSNQETAREFLEAVDSSVVLHNASTRFSDGYRFGFGAEIGISTSKTHARGPVGLEGLVIYKYIVVGDGHVVATYTGENPKPFTHKTLNKTWKTK